ncbi:MULTISPECIES: DsbA family protein [Phyllobacteriaceae]|jgi:protein-disulfide isomerase|uniref:Disulfide bond formation protein DsbA n=1 Tax=Mesorhizobium hungaricum TaxID=1566387 RepID=A0A1C2DJA9_9HYPH|nr:MULTISPECIES: DsbA family protein [Mesorhizobium]MBN9233255.1 DsbA family protein [Mesorhizobium sp.]MDQ0332056.1 protein-disulfide isomerase [Mesorhizobium sp. YL-MeA3-2017]OCX14854.1 disulfide bond formation protein DsbA [Mesorhizobium hungaricum]
MTRLLSRRTILTTLAVAPAALALAACNKAGEAEAEGSKPAETTKTADATKPAATPAAAAPQSSGSVNMAELLKPGVLPEKQLGKDDAKVTIIEYASMTCPHCAHFHETTLPELKTKYIDTGKVRLIFREFPFDPRAEAGFMLARCAGDNYFPMVDVLFKQQQNWAAAENVKDAMFQLSKLAGFTQESFNSCLTDQKLLDQVRSVQKRGQDEFKVDSTPTFFINGQTYKGALSIAEMSAIIDPLL